MSQQPQPNDGVWYARPAPAPEQEQQQAAEPLPAPPRLMLPDLQEIERAASRGVIGRASVQPMETSFAGGHATQLEPAAPAEPGYQPLPQHDPGYQAHPQAAPAQRGVSTADPAARRVAAPAVTATPLATPSAVAAATELVAGSPENDQPPAGDDSQADATDRGGPSGRMSRLHLGRHSIKRTTLATISVAPSGSGLVLGHDRQQVAVPIRLFAPEPVRVALVGGVWAAQLIIFRAFSLGARVTVITSEPAAWIGFGERATGQYNRLTVLSDDQAVPAAGTAQQPVLAVYDLRENRPAAAPALGPWRSQLTILRQLDRPGVPALQEAQLIMLQRLGGEEAALAATALRLPTHSGQFLQFMADDMLALVAEGTDRYLSLSQTRIEYDHVGPARR